VVFGFFVFAKRWLKVGRNASNPKKKKAIRESYRDKTRKTKAKGREEK